MRKWLERGLFVTALLVALGALLIVVGLLWLRSPWGNDFVRGQIVTRLGNAVTGRVELSRVRGNVLHGVTLIDFALVGPEGITLVAADTVQVYYSLRPFFRQNIIVDRVRMVRPDINLVRFEDGRWNFQTIWKQRPPREPGPPGWGSFVEVNRIQLVDGAFDLGFAEGGWGRIDWEENRFVDLNGELAVALHTRDENLRRFEARGLSFRALAPPLVVRRLDGTGVMTPDSLALREIELVTEGSRVRADGLIVTGDPARPDSFALAIRAPRVDLGEVKRFFPEVRLDGVASYEGRLVGPAGNPTLVVDRGFVNTGRSRVAVEGRLATLGSGLRLDLTTRADPLHPADVKLFVPAYPVAQPLSGPIDVAGPLRTLDVRADLRAPAGQLALEGTVDLARTPLGYDFVAQSRSLDLRALLGQPSADLVLSGTYRIAGRGTTERDLDARVSADLDRSRVFRWDVVAAQTRGRLRGRTYVADTLWARLPQTVLHGSGSFGMAGRGAMDAVLTMESEDLGDVWPTLERFGGEGRAEVRLSGTYGNFDVIGQVAAADVDVQGVTADSFAGPVQVTGVGSGAVRLTAEGTVYGLEAPMVRADSGAVRIEYAGQVLTATATLQHPGDAVSDVVATVDFAGRENVVTLEHFEHRSPEETLRMAEGSRLTVVGGDIVAENLQLTMNGEVLRANGVLSLDGESNLEFAAENLELQHVARLLKQPEEEWQGRATVAGTLRGTRANPIIDARAELTEGRIRGFSFVRVVGDMSYNDRTNMINVTITSPREGHDIVVTGRLPLDLALMGGVERLPEQPIDLAIRGVNTDFSLLGAFVPGLRDVSGPVDVRIDVRGTPGSPRFDGELAVHGGRVTVEATGVTYQDIEGRVVLTNDLITVERLTGTDGDDGRFEVAGTVAMENLQLGDLQLDLTATELAVMDQRRRYIQINGQATLTGTTRTPVLAGRVIVDEAIYRLPERRGKDVIDLEEAVIYVQIPGDEPEAGEVASVSLWNRTRMDMEIQVTDDAVFTASNARIDISGDLVVTKPSGTGTPTISGTLQVRRGYYEEFGRRFTIESGEVFFYGTPDLNPGLHVVATRTVNNVEGAGDVNIRIVIGGTLRNPTIDLESSPPFDKSEIISIALFGSPRVAASQQGQFEETVGRLAIGTASAELTGRLSEELGLDLFELQRLREEGGEQATLVRVGKLISPDVYLTFEQQFGGLEEESAVGIRYQMTEIFTLQATAGRRRERFTGGLDLFWEFTY